MTYKKGRYNLSATIFVPYDCNNNCKFCTSKKDYKDCSNFSLKNIIEKIKLLNENKLISEYVITGGEPFANIEQLKQIIIACDKPIYINTTLPCNTLTESINLINLCYKIKGINVSRHIGFNFNNVASIEDMEQITKPIRINTVINEHFTKEKFLEFCLQYGKKKRDINLRADYRYITFENLKSIDEISKFCLSSFDYINTESCIVCNSEHYSFNDKFIVSYHRGMEKSSYIINDICYVNDILVKQDGNIYKDWDCIYDENFNKWILQK